MFSINVKDIIGSHIGTKKTLSLCDDVSDVFQEIEFRAPLDITIDLIRTKKGVQVIFSRFRTTIISVWKKELEVILDGVEREFFLKKSDSDTDDIHYVNAYMEIDLTQGILEEILIYESLEC